MAKKKRPEGRPTDYKPEYCDLLVTHFKSGKSYAAFAALCDVSRSTCFEWEQKHIEFANAKSRGWEHYQAYWEQIGHEGVFTQTYKTDEGIRTVALNSAVWIYNMKCRFRKDWHDSVDVKAEIKAEGAEEVKELVAWLKSVREIE